MSVRRSFFFSTLFKVKKPRCFGHIPSSIRIIQAILQGTVKGTKTDEEVEVGIHYESIDRDGLNEYKS